MQDKFITHIKPLGPANHFDTVEQLEESLELLSNASPLRKVIENKATIIIGRKGSGKTAAMTANRGDATFGRYYGHIPVQHDNKKELTVRVNHWGHFHEINRRVASRAMQLAGSAGLDFVTDEHLCEFWEDEIWDMVFQTFYDIANSDEALAERLSAIIRLYNSEDIAAENATYLRQRVEEKVIESRVRTH